MKSHNRLSWLIPRLAGYAVCLGECSYPLASPADDYIAPSTNPPGGLNPANTPQMVLLTFDDLIDSTRYDLVQRVLTNHWNPNGSAIQATFFVNTD